MVLTFRRRFSIKKRIKILGFFLIIIVIFLVSKAKIDLSFEFQSLNLPYFPFEIETQKFLKQKNIFEILFLKKKLANQLLQKFPEVEKIKLSFNFKNFKITYKIFEPVARICNHFCAFVNSNGFIFPENQKLNLKTIYSKLDYSLGDRLQPVYLTIFKKLNEMKIDFQAFIILENGDVKIINDFIILFDPNQNIDNQFLKLQIALQQIPKVKYIDLRIPGRIFFY